MTDDLTRVIALTGELDLADQDRVIDLLLAAVRDPAVRDIVVDLADATFMDSEALAALIVGANAAQRAGKTVRLVNPTGTVRRVLEISGLFGYSLTAPKTLLPD